MSKKKKNKYDTRNSNKKSVLILANHDIVVYNFRLELIERLLADGYSVHISCPHGEYTQELTAFGAVCHDIHIKRHGKNPAADLIILHAYNKLICKLRPLLVLGYTIKPNVYGAMACRRAGVPFVANITGLGTAAGNGGMLQRLTVFLYKAAFTDVHHVFFQNKENMRFFQEQKIIPDCYSLLPGSGVNLKQFSFSVLSPCGNGKDKESVKFAFISRIMKEKGIEQYLAAAEMLKKKYPATEFHVCGFCEKEYKGRLEELDRAGVVIWHGMIKNVNVFMQKMHCIIHPTYYPEGLSNVLLEACACGRGIITTDQPGCRETCNGKNGYLIPPKDIKALIRAAEQFINLSQEQKEQMGREGRRLAEEKYSRQIVVDRYMDEIKNIEQKRNCVQPQNS